jgi:hypothetical protein
LECIFARGDRKLARVIERAYRLGACFDAWTERFKYDEWMQAFKDTGVDQNEYLCEQSEQAELPFEFIDCGVSREYLLAERKKAYAEECTEGCGKGCKGCGINREFKNCNS